MVAFPNFIGGAYQSQSALVDAERCENLFLERTESTGAPVPLALYPTPGLRLFATAAEGPGRALFAQDGRAFAVIGYKFYEFDSAGTLTDRGTVARDDTPATISSSGDGGDQLFITSAGFGYVFDLNLNTLSAAIAAKTFHQGGYLSTRFLGLDQTTSTFHVGNAYAGATWTEFAQRSLAPDKWQALLTTDQYIWLFGSETTEIWYDAGNATQPFAPIPGVLIPHGTAAPFSAALVGGQPAWLQRNKDGQGMVLRAQGTGEPARISTHGLELAIQGYSVISDAQGFSFQKNGHSFYALTFPTAKKTWVYDATVSAQIGAPAWHQRTYTNPTTGVSEAWRPNAHCFAFGKHLMTDRATGAIYELSASTYTDNGDAIRRVRACAFPANDYNQNYYHELQILMETGVGLQSGQGSDPTVMLRVSRDGGQTYGNERTASAGAVGQYLTRVCFQRLGRARGNPVFEVSLSDPVPFRMFGAEIEIERGIN